MTSSHETWRLTPKKWFANPPSLPLPRPPLLSSPRCILVLEITGFSDPLCIVINDLLPLAQKGISAQPGFDQTFLQALILESTHKRVALL